MLRKLSVPVVFIVILMALLLVCFAGMAQTTFRMVRGGIANGILCDAASNDIQTVVEFNSLINEATGENDTVGVETALLANQVTNVEGKPFVATIETEMRDGHPRPGGSGLISPFITSFGLYPISILTGRTYINEIITSNTPLFIAATAALPAGGTPLAGDYCPGYGDPATDASGSFALTTARTIECPSIVDITRLQPSLPVFSGGADTIYIYADEVAGEIFPLAASHQSAYGVNCTYDDTVYFKIVPDNQDDFRTNISPARGEAAQEPSACIAEGLGAETFKSRFEPIGKSLHRTNNSVTHVNIDAESVSADRSDMPWAFNYSSMPTMEETDYPALTVHRTNEYGSFYFNIIIVFDRLNMVRDRLLSVRGEEKHIPATWYSRALTVGERLTVETKENIMACALAFIASNDERTHVCDGHTTRFAAASASGYDKKFRIIIHTCKGQAQTSIACTDQHPDSRFDVVGALNDFNSNFATSESLIVNNNISIRKGQAQTSIASREQHPDLRFDVVGARRDFHSGLVSAEGTITDNSINHNNISTRKGQAQTPTVAPGKRPELRLDVVCAHRDFYSGLVSSEGSITDNSINNNNISTRKGQAQTSIVASGKRPELRLDVVGARRDYHSGLVSSEDPITDNNINNNISTRKGQAQTPTVAPGKRPELRLDVVGALSGVAFYIKEFRLSIIPTCKGQAQTPTVAPDQRPELRLDVVGALSSIGSEHLYRIITESANNDLDASFVYSGKPQAPSAYIGLMPHRVAGAQREADATLECPRQFADPLNYVNTLGIPITGKVGGAHTDASASYRTYATITHHDANYVSACDIVLNDVEPDSFAELRSNLLRVCDDRLLPPSSTIIRDNPHGLTLNIYGSILSDAGYGPLRTTSDPVVTRRKTDEVSCLDSSNKILIYNKLPATPTVTTAHLSTLRSRVTGRTMPARVGAYA